MALNQATKYGLFFVGGIAVGALGMALVSRGKLNIKPLATDLLASGIDLRDKALAAVDGVKEDLADVVAEAQVKQQEKKEDYPFIVFGPGNPLVSHQVDEYVEKKAYLDFIDIYQELAEKYFIND